MIGRSWFLLALFAETLAGQDGPKETSRQSEILRVDHRAGETITVRVARSSPGKSATCAIELEGESDVKSIVQAFNREEISIESRANRIFVKLLKDASGHLDVIGSSGTLYRFFLTAVDGGAGTEFVSVRPEAPKIEEKTQKELPQSLMLVRAMRVLKVPEGVTVRGAAQQDALVYRARGVEMSLLYSYESTRLTGYVCRLSNTSEESLHLDLSRFQAEKLILIGAKDLVVAPGAATLVYLVFDAE
jgi:hypothetical protein